MDSILDINSQLNTPEIDTDLEYQNRILDKINNEIQNLKNRISELKTRINTNKEKMFEFLRIAEQAKYRGDVLLLNRSTMQYSKLTNSNKQYNDLLVKAEDLLSLIYELYDRSNFWSRCIEKNILDYNFQNNTPKKVNIIQRLFGTKNKKATDSDFYSNDLGKVINAIKNETRTLDRYLKIASACIKNIDWEKGTYTVNSYAAVKRIEREVISLRNTNSRVDNQPLLIN